MENPLFWMLIISWLMAAAVVLNYIFRANIKFRFNALSQQLDGIELNVDDASEVTPKLWKYVTELASWDAATRATRSMERFLLVFHAMLLTLHIIIGYQFLFLAETGYFVAWSGTSIVYIVFTYVGDRDVRQDSFLENYLDEVTMFIASRIQKDIGQPP